MTDDRADRRLRPGHWLLIGIVVVLVAVGVAVVVRRGSADPTVADPTGPPSSAASTSATPRADCAPEVTATWADGSLFKYGFIYRNRCDQVVRELRFRVAALDKGGRQVTEGDEITSGGVLLPGTELAAAGNLQLAGKPAVASLRVQVIGFVTSAPEVFSGWAQPKVGELVRGKPDKYGTFDVTAQVSSDAPLCVADYVLVLRDRADKVIFVGRDAITTQTRSPSFSVVPLPALDFTRTRIYAPQVTRGPAEPAPGAPCTGS